MKAQISQFARSPVESRNRASELETLDIFIAADANRGAQVPPRVGGRRSAATARPFRFYRKRPPTTCTCVSKTFLIFRASPPKHRLPHNPNDAAGETRCIHLLSCPPPDVVLGSRPPAPPKPTAPGTPGAPIPGGVPLCLSKLPGLEK